MRRRRRKILSVVAVALGIAVATAVGTIALDVGDRVNLELRSFGANIAVTPAADGLPVTVGGVDYRPAGSGAFLNEADLVNLRKIFWRNNIVAFAPSLYVPVTIQNTSAVLVGSWFDKELVVSKKEAFRTGLKQLHPTWRVVGQWPNDSDSSGSATCLVGRRLAKRLGLAPGSGTGVSPVGVHGQDAHATLLIVTGILETGGPEDDQIIAPLASVQKMAGLEGKVRRIEVSALTKPEDDFARSDVTKLPPAEFDRWYCTPYVRSIASQIQQAIPGSAATPIYQVADSEGKILSRVGILLWVLAEAALITLSILLYG